MHEHVGLLCRHLKVTSPAENDGYSSHQKNKEETKVWSSCLSYHMNTIGKNCQQGNTKREIWYSLFWGSSTFQKAGALSVFSFFSPFLPTRDISSSLAIYNGGDFRVIY
jgi:hypothetical protein